MARVKRAVNAAKKRRTTLERAEGYRAQYPELSDDEQLLIEGVLDIQLNCDTGAGFVIELTDPADRLRFPFADPSRFPFALFDGEDLDMEPTRSEAR